MSRDRAYLAVDLGASSGRVILGRFGDGRLSLVELHRFEQPTCTAEGRQRWDLKSLLREVETGLAAAGSQAGALAGIDPAAIRSVGVCGWGVDYGLLDARGELTEDPIRYRDPRTEGMLDTLLARLPASEWYARTGIQLLPLNTSVQLLAQTERGEWPAAARRLLMIPDLVHRHLCGAAVGERTNASTTQLMNATTRQWDDDLVRAVGVAPDVMPALVDAGTYLGELDRAIAERTGLRRCRVVAPATHDTASAVAGTPLAPGWAFLSSGTWSLLGLETATPVLSEEARRLNVTNEAGVYGSNRLLKNVMGLWLIESCRERWQEQGLRVDHDALLGELDPRQPGAAFIDPDDPCFLNPPDMPAAIQTFLRRTDQPVPETPAEIARVVLVSLALRYAQIVAALDEITGCAVPGVHIVGGGSRNAFLNQATATATGLPVSVGHVEATAVGNLLVQAVTDATFPDIDAARASAAAGSTSPIVRPGGGQAWEAARRCFEHLSQQPLGR